MQAAGNALAGGAFAACDEPVVLQYEVTGAPGGKRSYSLRFAGDTASLIPGVDKAPSTSFALDYDTAAAIAKGELSAQAAFMQGRLKLGGDVTLLVRQHQILEGIDDSLAQLRELTEF